MQCFVTFTSYLLSLIPRPYVTYILSMNENDKKEQLKNEVTYISMVLDISIMMFL